MNSSGIKRGLATTAVSALAIAGLPLFASSASAAPGDSPITVAYTGPALNAGDQGALVVLKVPAGSVRQQAGADDPATPNVDESLSDLALTGVSSSTIGSQNTDTKNAQILGYTVVPDNANNEFGGLDTFDEVQVRIKTTTTTTGDTVAFRIFNQDGNTAATQNNTLDAGEARTDVSITTSGPVADITVTPASRTAPQNERSDAYTLTLKDAAGRTTQLASTDSVTVTDGAASTFIGSGLAAQTSLDSAELERGTVDLTASAATAGTYPISFASVAVPTADAQAELKVTPNADIAADEFDLVTGADTWTPGATPAPAFGGTGTQIRVDQNSVTFNFASKDGIDLDTTPDDANTVVVLTLTRTGGNVLFDGKDTKKYYVPIGADGKGSLTVALSGVNDAGTFTFDSPSFTGGPENVSFTRPTATSVSPDAAAYVTKVGSPTTVTVAVVDQFGNAIGAPAEVQLVRAGRAANAGTTARVPVGADGKATFTLPDAGTTPGTETFTINLFSDSADGSATNVAGGTINYTADGLGADPIVTGITTDATATKIAPLYDSAAGAGDSVTVNIAGATPNTVANVSVDNGALILTGAETNLSQGSASDKVTLAGGAGSFKVVGTKLGVTTLTIVNAGRTEVYKLTVTREGLSAGQVEATARNVELEGPESVVAGDVATYVATVTDAFGNTVPGVTGAALNFTVSGPGNLQNKETATDANGELEQTVLLTDNANGNVIVKVTGNNTGNVVQFGKKANQFGAAENDAPGLSASMDSDSVTSTVKNLKALQQAVEDAQAALAEAQANLAAAQANLDVAKAELAVAQAQVDTLTAKKAELRQKLNKAKENGNRQKAKTTRKKLRAVKRDLRDAQAALTVAQTKADSLQVVVDLRQDQVDKAQADLDEAEAALEEAQG